jgi:hypothetical protein
MSSGPIVIRSYRRVFNVERKIYKVDKYVLPRPLELRAAVYFIGALLFIVLVSRLPVIGLPLGVVGWQYKFVVLPLAVAVLGTRVTPDGRPAHRYVVSVLGYALRGHRFAGAHTAPLEGEPVPYEVETWVAGDAGTPDLSRARVRGPATVYFRDQMIVDLPTSSRWQRRRRIRPYLPGSRASRRQEITDSVAVRPGETVEITP